MPAARRLAALLLVVPGAASAQAAPTAPTPLAHDTLRIAFVGDINLARSLASNYIFKGRQAEVFALVQDRLRAADIAVGNLESLLLERGRYADTTGSWKFAGPQAEGIAMLKDAGFDVLGDANNHAWDFGEAGLLENLRHLDSAGVVHAGTGPDPVAAWRPALVHARGWTVAIFSLTAIFNDSSLTVVGLPAECCIAWADTLRAARQFRLARDSLGADLVIAFVHAGLEYRPAPRPTEVRRFRGLIRAGADAVIGHHPHVPQGTETLNGRPIAYSLGNFVFKQGQPWTNRGLWAELTIVDGQTGGRADGRAATDGRTGGRADRQATPARPSLHLTLLPLAVGYQPRFLTGRDSAAVMAHVRAISKDIRDLPSLPRAGARRRISHPRRPPRAP